VLDLVLIERRAAGKGARDYAAGSVEASVAAPASRGSNDSDAEFMQ
jgi:hypothetical protein